MPDADILRSLDRLNQAFANVDYYDQNTGADTDLQFCLARRTPDNQPSNGITRTVSPLTNLNPDVDDRALKDLSRFAPREYINVWIVKDICGLGLGCSVAGYAYYPSAHGRDVDGVVVEARTLTGGPAGVTTLIHELGHYLGLKHTFEGGCKNDDCTTDGDAVCDTPPDASKVGVPCSGSVNTCGTDANSGFVTDQVDMFWNYMDYSHNACKSAFTSGQGDRMRFFVEGRRGSLLASRACLPPCPTPVTAAFDGGEITVEAGATITFTSASTGGNGNQWSVNGVPVTTNTNLIQAFADEGVFTIQLRVNSNDALCGSDSVRQRVRVVCTTSAAFDGPASISAGSATTFNNTSSPGGAYTWLIDGALAGTGDLLATTFPTPGLYEVCLQADFSGCEDEVCRPYFVTSRPCAGPDCPGVPTGCTPSSVFAYGGGDRGASTFTALTALPDGFLVGGAKFGAPTISRMSSDGSTLWNTQVYPEVNDAWVSSLLVDSDGHVVALVTGGASGTPDNRRASVVRLDGGDGSLLWGRTFTNPMGGLAFRGINQPTPGADYRVYGLATENAGLTPPELGLRGLLDPATGAPSNTTTFGGSGAGLRFEPAPRMAAGATYVATPVNSTGPLTLQLTAFDEGSGTEVFVRDVDIGPIAPSPISIATGSGHAAIVTRAAGSLDTDPLTITLTDLDGNLVWNKTLSLPRGGSVASLVATGVGFVLLVGSSPQGLQTVHFDVAGNVLYAWRYGDLDVSSPGRFPSGDGGG